ncbi:MAG TPA: GAF domain-containing protein [Methylomirabilota bacterium]|nr:GAF domain-containing protein [Methylomirabilota bacterium]
MSEQPASSTELRSLLAKGREGFPFACEFSLAPLVRFWEQAAREASAQGAIARALQERLRQAPALAQPLLDPAELDPHRDLLAALMTAIFPPASWESDFGAAVFPFYPQGFYATPSFLRLLLAPDGVPRGRVNVDHEALIRLRTLNAYSLILKRLYDIDMAVHQPLVFTLADPETGLDRHFKTQFDMRFLDVETDGPAPVLSTEARRHLQSRITDLGVLQELLPPARFRFRGFSVMKEVEITDQEVISALKRDLIDKESIVSTARFTALQEKLRTLFRRPQLYLALAAIDGDRVLKLNSGARLEHACIFADSIHHKTSDFSGSIFERAVLERRPLFIADLETWPGRTRVEESILEHGARSVIVAPLVYQDAVIGTLELLSPTPGDLDATHGPRLDEILPLFAMAVKRSVDELNARLQAQIKDKFTAIHPVVEWRFRKAVLDSMDRRAVAGEAGPGEIAPIVFREVHPLYALSDIRGSSTHRAWAIQADLLAQLGLARDVLRTAYEARRLPILDQMTHRIDGAAGELEVTLRSGDELALIGFLRREIEPLFDHLGTFGPEVRERIDAYRSALDPQLGALYRRRKAFEESLTLITDAVSAYLDMEEQAAQAMFPHYFEKQRTDGVDYSIYVGASLLEDGRYDPLYLRNLRLWQLMVACGAAIRADRLKERLEVPLEVTNLILVQHAPLSIRFRFDEKRFDVDGAYNVRYEIIKKRIDKAVVNGTSERLTQPAKIAIVYSQNREAAEYRDYIGYLQKLGYLTREIEELELEELQGVPGLRALRVSVDLANARVDATAALGTDASRLGSAARG